MCVCVCVYGGGGGGVMEMRKTLLCPYRYGALGDNTVDSLVLFVPGVNGKLK